MDTRIGNGGAGFRALWGVWGRRCLKPGLWWGLLVVVLLLIMHPPQVLVVLGEPQMVRTANAKVGVHTRLADEVETWKIQRTLQLTREMGAGWVVEYFPWAYYEPKQGSYHWDHADTIVEHAQNQGVRVIARLGMVPEWARPDPEELETTFNYLDEEAYPAFAAYVGEFVARYRGTVDHIIIWNEPNLNFEWGFRPADPEAYTRMLAEVYAAAHAANPEIVVLAGALAPTLEPENGHAGMSDLIYLRRMYEAGAAEHFDALAAHAYGLAFPPEMSPDPEVLNFRRVELLREIMDSYGDGEKLIYITESGWNDHPRWTWAVKPGQRIAYTVEAFAWAEEVWPWCPVVAMWVFRTPRPLRNYQDYFSFVTPDFQPRPIYQVLSEEFVGSLDTVSLTP